MKLKVLLQALDNGAFTDKGLAQPSTLATLEKNALTPTHIRAFRQFCARTKPYREEAIKLASQLNYDDLLIALEELAGKRLIPSKSSASKVKWLVNSTRINI